ncbi:MAG: hypothetical protein P0S96_05000 [Simkaniaceae bacterium]|nr:hypothetical protein [Candidatus Sacchlamyda saccharinae]
MFLTVPRHEILAYEGVRIPYSAKFLYDLCAYRDQPDNKSTLTLRKITTEVAFIGFSALSLIEAVVRLPFAFLSIAFSSNPKFWFEGVEKAIMTSLYALSATVCNFFVDNLTQTIVGLECKLTFFSQNQLLFHACETGQYQVAKDLVNEEGADPHKVQDSTQVSPALISHLVGHEDMQDLFKLNKYEEGYLELKRLAHWLSLEGTVKLEGRDLKLQGAQSHWFFESLAESFQRFRTWGGFSGLALSSAKADLLQEALIKAYATQDYETIATRIRGRNLTFLSTGWEDHAISITFHGSYMAIGNTGNSSIPTLQVFKIDSSKVTASIIEEMFTHQHWNEATGQNFFYHKLPKKLSSSGQIQQDATCKAFAEIAPKHQKAPNCAFASKKATLPFAWATLVEAKPSKKIIQRARFESKLYTNYTALQYLDEANLAKKYPHLQTFADRAHRKGQKKLEKVQSLCLKMRHIPGLLRTLAL